MSETLKPWYAIATPHEDIREGRLAEAVFAANLWAVVQGMTPQALFEVLPRDLEDWKLINALLGERPTLRAEGKGSAFKDSQLRLFYGHGGSQDHEERG
ncbi:MAG: hypothetical protein WHX93_07975 [bacterium]